MCYIPVRNALFSFRIVLSGFVLLDCHWFVLQKKRGEMAAEMAEKLVSQLTLRAEEEPEEVVFFLSSGADPDPVPFWPLDTGSEMGKKSGSGFGTGSYFRELRNNFSG
jgi:hypothetical protein